MQSLLEQKNALEEEIKVKEKAIEETQSILKLQKLILKNDKNVLKAIEASLPKVPKIENALSKDNPEKR